MTDKRNIYLKMKTLTEARSILFENFPRPDDVPPESAAVPDAVGRVLAEPVFAKLSSPSFHASAMDGIAVNAEDTYGASETSPLSLAAGKNAFYVNTGHVLPEGTNAVIMIENINELDDGTIEIEAPAFPWQNVRKMGEDIVATELIFAQNHEITPYCVGALLSGGIFSVNVRRIPKVLIIPTGTELVDWRTTPVEKLKPGQVIESNGFVLAALVQSCGCNAVQHDAVEDIPEKIKAAVAKGVADGYDAILTVGGSSAGSKDYTKTVVDHLGEVLVHGVTIMPGKPVLIGKVKKTPVFGIPGYPVSAIIAFEQFVRPLLYKMQGKTQPGKETVSVEPVRKMPSKLGVEEFLRMKLGKVGNRIVATPLPRGAGSITTITEADGIIRIPQNSEGINENEPVTAELLRPLSAINNTVVIVGSHDNTLDILADEIKRKKDGITISSSHVGSMGGLMAIKRGACHMAGSHLLDTNDGSYNISDINKFLPEKKVRVVNLVLRSQGLIVAKGNPNKIRRIGDLAGKNLMFINRQGGSGTRILFDYKLRSLGLSPDEINGYNTEEYTHMSVAAAVLSGAADAGLGICAAARALNLDFIPVVTEQYDLVICDEFFNTENIQSVLDTVRSDRFKKRVEALGGYDTSRTGEIIL